MDWLTYDRIVAAATLALTAIGALIGWRVYRVERDRDRRKLPIVEPRLERGPETDGWQRVYVTIRNREAVAVRLLAFRTTAKGALLLHPRDASREDGFGGTSVQGGPRLLDKAATRIKYELTVSPLGSEAGIGRVGDTGYCDFLVHGPCREDQIHAEWRWADGQRD